MSRIRECESFGEFRHLVVLLGRVVAEEIDDDPVHAAVGEVSDLVGGDIGRSPAGVLQRVRVAARIGGALPGQGGCRSRSSSDSMPPAK